MESLRTEKSKHPLMGDDQPLEKSKVIELTGRKIPDSTS